MSSAVLFEEQVRVPFVTSLEEFREWAQSEDFPERGRIDYIGGQIEVDMSPEDLFTHGTLKTEVASKIYLRVQKLKAGEVFIDRARISCPDADLSVEPDVVFVSNRSFDSGRVRLIPKASEEPGRFIELEGPPDLVVEVVSDASVTKDTKRLPAAYSKAGVKELWIIDARKTTLEFSIYHHGRTGLSLVPADKNGFKQSSVLRCRYRLTRKFSPRGWAVYKLHERA
jgi:Uma2 family endonuclease